MKLKAKCPNCGENLVSYRDIQRGKGIDPAAFRRLVEAGFDARPADVDGSFASKSPRKVKAAKEAAKTKAE